MKKYLQVLTVGFFLIFNLFVVFNVSVAADGDKTPGAVTSSIENIKIVGEEAKIGTEENVFVIIGRVIGWVLSISSIVLVIVIVYGGITWMTAGGETPQMEKAKKAIVQGVIGLIITLGTYAITNFVVTRFTVIQTLSS